jgi:NADPH2:quinone reductase
MTRSIETTIPLEMTAIVAARPGGPEVLSGERIETPVPRAGEVLIRVAAAGINAPDLAQRRGAYPPPPGASPLLGLEVAGEIAALGADVAGWAVGDRAVALCNGGGYAEYVAVPAGQVLPAPRGWSLAAAAALPETFFTVMQTLVMRSGLGEGMSVLVHGAAGGIGGAALQLSRHYGARPIGIVSSPERAAYATSLGAVATIDRKTEDFAERTLALTEGKGADRVVELVGGGTLGQSIRASARFGHIVQVATLGGSEATIDVRRLMASQLTLSGSTLRPQTPAVKAAIAARLRAEVWPALEDGRIRRPRTRALPLAEAARGHALMEDPVSYGKIVLLTVWGADETDNAIEMA